MHTAPSQPPPLSRMEADLSPLIRWGSSKRTPPPLADLHTIITASNRSYGEESPPSLRCRASVAAPSAPRPSGGGLSPGTCGAQTRSDVRTMVAVPKVRVVGEAQGEAPPA